MRIVVTGGAGFIGANLCRTLAARADVSAVVAYDDLSTGFRANLDHLTGVELVEGSILDADALRRVAAGADAIAHLAARPSVPLSLADPIASHHVNVTGTVQVLEAAREVGAYVVVASSSAVYGENPATPKREDMAQAPVSPYGVTKVATEGYAAAYLESFGVPTLALRFFNVFGPLQPAGHAYAAVVPAFVSATLEERPIPMHGDGEQVRDFVFVDTVAQVLAQAVIDRVVHASPVNLASGTRTTLLGLVSELEAIVGRRLQIEHLPARQGDIRDSHADQTAFKSLFPDIAPVDLRTGLLRTLEWFERSARQPR
ncbi:MAG: NAD-dependent epimerase/dehydratase family protein [Actinomycetota bacterium]